MEIVDLLTHEPLITLAVKNKIKNFITPDLYHDLDDFIKDNPTFEDFKKNAKFDDAYRRALNWNSVTLTEEEYQQILSELKAELEEKMRLEKDKITTTKANGKEIATFTKDDGTVIAVDNSHGDKPIDEQLKDMQEKYSRFRQDGNTNTEELMEFAQNEVKEAPSFEDADKINTGSLSQENAEKAEVAKDYQAQTDNSDVSVDLENGIILDQGTVLEIQHTDEGYEVVAPDESIGEQAEELSADGPTKAKVKQKTLGKRNPLKQAGFSDAIILALLTGMFIGLAILNIYIKTL